ncbi:MAG: lysophospholipid acyltransferase family protein [Bacteroidales bacterium]
MNLPLIINDSYETPGGVRRFCLDRLIPGLQLGFKLHFVGVVIRSRRACAKGVYDDEAWAASSLENFRLLERGGGIFHVYGVEHFRKLEGPVVFVSNHMSTLETMVFPFLIAPHKRVTFVVKDSLVTHPIFGPIMRSRDPIVVSRHNSREDLVEVMTKGQRLLAGGSSVVIFPQSTRRLEFRPEEFNTLGVKLASKAGVPVIPVAIKTDFWLNGRILKDLGPLDLSSRDIRIRFGQPLMISGSGKEDNQTIIRFIQSHLEEWGSA